MATDPSTDPPTDPSADPPTDSPTDSRTDTATDTADLAENAHLSRVVAGLFVLASLAAAALFVVYVTGGQTQLEGALLFVSFGAIGLGLGVWIRRIVGTQEVIEQRYPDRSPEAARAAFKEEFEASLGETTAGGRRTFLLRLALASGGVIGLALLVPIRSLGPGPENELFETPWAEGMRLVDGERNFVRASDIVPDQVITVFPEAAPESADGQAVVIGLPPERFAPERLPAETVDNIVCYSKVCTHAGCPVGLYRARASELLCPCHQSTFDVRAGAPPVSGPAARPLPQLPLGVDDEGVLIALGGFTEPVGPTFWNITDAEEASS